MEPKRAETYEVTRHGRTVRVTVPDDPKLEDILADALRECLSPHTLAAIAAYLQPVRTMDAELVRQVRWFATLLTTVVGGEDQLNRLCDEVGL